MIVVPLILGALVASSLKASIPITPPAAHAISARALLYSLDVRKGQTFTWLGRVTDRWVDSTHRPAVHVFTIHTDEVTCSVVRGRGDDFIASRRVKVTLSGPPLNLPPALSADACRVCLRTEPSIIFREGREFLTDGPPLREDPGCLFYSIPMYGQPPRNIDIGTTWPVNDHSFTALCKSCSGTTEVTALDPIGHIVGLRVLIRWPGVRRGSQIDMVVADGGVVTRCTELDDFVTVSAIPKDVGTPNGVLVWRLIHR